MSFVRLTVVLAVSLVSTVVLGQPQAASRPDDATALHNWPVAFGTIHRVAADALMPETSALPSAATHFIEMAPCRVYDSRVVAGGPGPIPSATARTIQIASGPCAGIPSNAAGFSLNLTVTGSPSSSSYAFITAYPTGTTRPNAATVNFLAGTQEGNAAIVPAGTGGAIDVYVSLQTELIVDINGYFAAGVVTSVVAGVGLSGGGTGDVNLSIPDGGITPGQLSATGSTSGQVLTSNGATAAWQNAGGATGAAGGDLSGTYPNPAVATVGGQSAANVAGGAVLANGATNTNTSNAIVRRDGAGNFSAGTITASLNGNATSATTATTATNFTGSLAGEVTGTQGATVVSNAVATNTAGTIVRRDASGDFSAGTVTLSGNLVLPATTSSSAGAITIAGDSFAHAYGSHGTFVGRAAGNFTMTGLGSTALGFSALAGNTTGNGNTATGDSALMANTIGSANTAAGQGALIANTTGSSNTATGVGALASNLDGCCNTAIGANALLLNSSGNYNVAIGPEALLGNTTGGQNIAIGFGAGTNLTTGFNNIDLANPGVAGESSTTRIGRDGFQLSAFIAGVSGVTTAGPAVPVLIDGSGQLGTLSSSRRYKFDIADMDHATDDLMRLRPVKFRYLAHGDNAPLQYGLVAEEVAEVYPELVTRNRDGEVETVMYQFLAPMLLNVVQQQQKTIDSLEQRIAALEQAIGALKRKP